MNGVARAGTAVRRPAPSAIRSARRPPRARSPRAIGAASAPQMANGRADASAVGPSSQMNGTWTSDASGIQCPLLAIGSTGFDGSLPPTSTKIQTKSTEKPWPAARLRATST